MPWGAKAGECVTCECQGTALKPCLQRWPCWGVTDLQCGWCIVLWYNSLDSSGVFQDFLLAERLSPICSYSSSPARKEKLGKSLGILPWVSACIYTRQLQRKRFFFQMTLKWSPLLALSSKCIWTLSDGSDKEPKCRGLQNHGVTPSAALLARLCCHLLCGGNERLGSDAFLAWRAWDSTKC